MTDTYRNPVRLTESTDRRANRRFELRGEAWFQWDNDSGKCVEGTGSTRNVSRNGVFVETAMVPPLRKALTVVVTFPGVLNQGGDIWLHGAGQALRLEPQPERARGFGAQVGFQTGGIEKD